MKPFKPNPQQLGAIANGCTKLWIPLKSSYQDGKLLTYYGDCKDEYDNDEFVYKHSDIQPNGEYFVQEEFGDLFGDVVYKANISKPIQGLFNPANQMTEQQSRFKFKVTGVEVKQVQNVNLGEWQEVKKGLTISESLSLWHDSQYPQQLYNSNPWGFLIDIEVET